MGWSGALCEREIGSLYLSASPFKIPFVGRNEKEGEKCKNSVRPAPASGSLSCPSGGRCLQKTAVDKTSVYLLPRLTGCVRCRGNGGETHCHERASGHPASAAKGNSSKRQIAIYSKVTLLSLSLSLSRPRATLVSSRLCSVCRIWWRKGAEAVRLTKRG